MFRKLSNKILPKEDLIIKNIKISKGFWIYMYISYRYIHISDPEGLEKLFR